MRDTRHKSRPLSNAVDVHSPLNSGRARGSTPQRETQLATRHSLMMFSIEGLYLVRGYVYTTISVIVSRRTKALVSIVPMCELHYGMND